MQLSPPDKLFQWKDWVERVNALGIIQEPELRQALTVLPGWMKHENGFQKEFVFHDLIQAMGFVQSIALLAERVHHHPDISICWNKVTLLLSTHSLGEITSLAQ